MPSPRVPCTVTSYYMDSPTGTFWCGPRRGQSRRAERGLGRTKCPPRCIPTFLRLAQATRRRAKARSDDLLFMYRQITSPNFKSRAPTWLMERVAESQ